MIREQAVAAVIIAVANFCQKKTSQEKEKRRVCVKPWLKRRKT